MSDAGEPLARLLERAARDGHTAVPTPFAVSAVGLAAVEAGVLAGTAVADDAWVAAADVAVAEEALADEVLGLASEDRLALVLGEVPATAEVVTVPQVHLRSVADVAEALQAVPPDVRVVLSGDPDALPGPAPGDVLAALLAWGRLPVRDLRPDGAGATSALQRLPAAVRAGELPEPGTGEDRSVVAVPCADDDEVVRRAVQVVSDSVPRVFGVDAHRVLVVTPLERGTAGARHLAEVLPGNDVRTVHSAAASAADAVEAVVACLPGQAAGVLSRALVYSAVVLATRHLSVVSAAGDALPRAVAEGLRRPRWTRLPGLLDDGPR